MDSRSVLALLFVVGAAYAVSSGSRVSGGVDAFIEAFPFAAQVEQSTLGIFWEQICGAAILNRLYMLSSAQCYGSVLSNYRVRYGAVLRGTGGATTTVASVTNYPNYDADTLNNDITLVRLSNALDYNERVQPGVITAAGVTLPSGFPVTVLGWGLTYANTEAYQLQALQTSTIDRETCADRLETDIDSEESTEGPISTMRPEIFSGPERTLELTSSMLCVVDTTAAVGTGACEGDIGSPVVVLQQNTSIIVGVSSWANGCEATSRPTVATAVSEFTQWIVSNAI